MVEEDLLISSEDFYHDKLDRERLNYTFVVLIPKKHFRPIIFLNSLYKIISKTLALKLSKLLLELVDLA